MSKHAELIARLEAAGVGSRELDAEIYEVLNPSHSRVSSLLGRYFDPQIVSARAAEKYITKGTFVAPWYTSSIDDALRAANAIIPSQEYEIQTIYGVARASMNLNHEGNSSPFYGSNECGNVPLALCIAMLKALEAKQ